MDQKGKFTFPRGVSQKFKIQGKEVSFCPLVALGKI